MDWVKVTRKDKNTGVWIYLGIGEVYLRLDKYSLIDVYMFAVVFPQALVAEIEQNQIKLDECQTHSKLYCTSVKVNTNWNLTKTVEYFNDWYFF